MFGSLGVPELLLIFVVILIVFGPRRIPEIGRTLGKAMGEFRKATDDLKSTIEREVRLEELQKIAPPSMESFMTPSEAVSRSEPFPSAATEIIPADTASAAVTQVATNDRVADDYPAPHDRAAAAADPAKISD
jgi:TatA/E family protein of Tat protein translocase